MQRTFSATTILWFYDQFGPEKPTLSFFISNNHILLKYKNSDNEKCAFWSAPNSSLFQLDITTYSELLGYSPSSCPSPTRTVMAADLSSIYTPETVLLNSVCSGDHSLLAPLLPFVSSFGTTPRLPSPPQTTKKWIPHKIIPSHWLEGTSGCHPVNSLQETGPIGAGGSKIVQSSFDILKDTYSTTPLVTMFDYPHDVSMPLQAPLLPAGWIQNGFVGSQQDQRFLFRSSGKPGFETKPSKMPPSWNSTWLQQKTVTMLHSPMLRALPHTFLKLAIVACN